MILCAGVNGDVARALILAAFRVRSFRFQWPADLFTSWAFEMETLILGWYVMVNTGSVLLLTVFGSLQFLGTLAAPMLGVLGDQLGGRIMLCAMRTIYIVLAALMSLLALTGMLTPAWVLLAAALTGLVRPNDLVMRNALIGETLAPAQHLGALGLSRATSDSARVAGALAGAVLSARLGIGPAYLVVTTLYMVSLGLTLGVARRPAAPAVFDGHAGVTLSRPSHWRDLREGMAHIVKTPELLAFMWLAFLINLTAYPVSGGLLPYVAQRVFHVGATGLGWLVASFSIGGLLGSLVVIISGGQRRPERSTVLHTMIWFGLLLVFGHVQSFGAGLLLLLAAGYVQNVAMISMAATLLHAAGDRFRGRVMGVRTLAVYGLPLGLMASGALIERIGYPLTISGAAGVGLLCTLLIGIRWRASIWQRNSTSPPGTSVPQRV